MSDPIENAMTMEADFLIHKFASRLIAQGGHSEETVRKIYKVRDAMLDELNYPDGKVKVAGLEMNKKEGKAP